MMIIDRHYCGKDKDDHGDGDVTDGDPDHDGGKMMEIVTMKSIMINYVDAQGDETDGRWRKIRSFCILAARLICYLPGCCSVAMLIFTKLTMKRRLRVYSILLQKLQVTNNI